MSAFSVLHLPDEVLTGLRLPLFRYEVPTAYLGLVKIDPFNPPLEAMLYSLQERAADGRADWEGMAGPMERLTELLCKKYGVVGLTFGANAGGSPLATQTYLAMLSPSSAVNVFKLRLASARAGGLIRLCSSHFAPEELQAFLTLT